MYEIVEMLLKQRVMVDIWWNDDRCTMVAHWDNSEQQKAYLKLMKKNHVEQDDYWDRWDSKRFYFYFTAVQLKLIGDVKK